MLVYATGAGITAAAGTRLALQLILIAGFGYGIHCEPCHPYRTTKLLFVVAASPVNWYWAIYAPAAHLSGGSRFLGSLSGIEP